MINAQINVSIFFPSACKKLQLFLRERDVRGVGGGIMGEREKERKDKLLK